MAGGIAADLKKPFAQQIAAFRLRLENLVGTTAWDDLSRAQHDRAFMVAGAMKADLLADLAASVDRAVSEGGTLESFRKDFRGIVERHGWHGWTGEESARGQAWRTRVIYKTNMATSYAAGRLAQLREGKFAFWVYRHGGSLEPRLDHLSWNAVALEPDHPFWATHYPPNGWGCSCYVVGARTAAGVRRLGGNPDKALPEGWQAISPKTGAPVGIDKNWDYAPGASVAEDITALAEKPVKWSYELGKAFMDALPLAARDQFATAFRSLPSLQRDLEQFAVKSVEGLPTGPAQIRSLGLLTGKDVEKVKLLANIDAAGFDFAVDASAVRHVIKRHGDARIEVTRGQMPVVPEDFGLLSYVLNAPDEVSFDPPVSGGGAIIRYSRSIGGVRFVALMEVRTGRRRLALKTLWKEVVNGPRP